MLDFVAKVTPQKCLRIADTIPWLIIALPQLNLSPQDIATSMQARGHAHNSLPPFLSMYLISVQVEAILQ